MKITVQTTVDAPMAEVWRAYSAPDAIKQWNAASDDWHTTESTVVRDECSRAPGPGVLAYVDGEPAGWCSVAPRSTYRRLMNSRTIPFVDDLDPWSVVCFVVRAGFRRQGLMHHLLDGAVQHARDSGAEVVEGYPADADTGRIDVISGYVGTTRLFEAHGFTRAVQTTGVSGGKPRWVMRRELADTPSTV